MSLRLNALTAKQLLAKLLSRQCTVKQITEDCLAQIKEFDSTVQAWTHINPDLALSAATELDKQLHSGVATGKLLGVPIGIKDVFNTSDMPTQMGSPIWKGFQPGNDARVVHYLRMSQAVILGKTVTAEFAVHTPGTTRNPHNPEYMPGTSSSGSAAAVSSRMVPLALGTQTAGSILRPSSYCGVYGFKPSFGLIPRTGVLKTTDTLDTIGGFARCIDDLTLLFETIRVKGRDFPVSEKHLNDQSRREKPKHRPWQVGLVKGPKWGCAEPYAQQSIFQFAQQLAAHGEINVEEVLLPIDFDRAHEVHSTIYDRTLAYYFQREFKQGSLVSPTMYEIVERGNRITLGQYQQALQQQHELSQQLDSLMQNKFDFLICLTTGGEALKGLDSVDRPDNCLLWTLCGVPDLNLPVFQGPNRLPFGAQLVSRRYNDYLLLNFAKLLEQWGLAGNVLDPTSKEVYQTPKQEGIPTLHLQTGIPLTGA